MSIPKQTIDFIVGRMYIGTSDADVKADIERRCVSAPGWNKYLVKEAVEYAIKSHRKNQALYERVMSGRF